MKKAKKTSCNKCRIKSGDTVIIIAGSHKGEKGKVIEVWPEERQVVVAGINVRRKKTRDSDGRMTRQAFQYPINISNVAFLDPRYEVATRIGYEFTTSPSGEVKKVRIAKKSSEQI